MNCRMKVSVCGIDTSEHCGPQPNIDLVYFVWEHFLRFSYKKIAMALSHRGSASRLPELLFLKHYRVESDTWKDSGNCDACVEHHMDMMFPFHVCDLSSNFKCKICTRQPPSLAFSARHVLFNYTLHLDRFTLKWIRFLIYTCTRPIQFVGRGVTYYHQRPCYYCLVL